MAPLKFDTGKALWDDHVFTEIHKYQGQIENCLVLQNTQKTLCLRVEYTHRRKSCRGMRLEKKRGGRDLPSFFLPNELYVANIYVARLVSML